MIKKKNYKEQLSGKNCVFHEFINRTVPREGAYVHGMFMEGARWDIQSGIIVESRLKELFPPMPVINIRVSRLQFFCNTTHHLFKSKSNFCGDEHKTY